MLNGKWMRQGDFKAVAVAAPYGSGEWKLFDIQNDPGETNNLAQTRPKLLKKLKSEWDKYAEDVGVILTE